MQGHWQVKAFICASPQTASTEVDLRWWGSTSVIVTETPCVVLEVTAGNSLQVFLRLFLKAKMWKLESIFSGSILYCISYAVTANVHRLHNFDGLRT